VNSNSHWLDSTPPLRQCRHLLRFDHCLILTGWHPALFRPSIRQDRQTAKVRRSCLIRMGTLSILLASGSRDGREMLSLDLAPLSSDRGGSGCAGA
jgi:hypothetical protein